MRLRDEPCYKLIAEMSHELIESLLHEEFGEEGTPRFQKVSRELLRRDEGDLCRPCVECRRTCRTSPVVEADGATEGQGPGAGALSTSPVVDLEGDEE